MSLFPTLNVPTDHVKLYSLPEPVKIRSYVVGEEKLLILARESKDPTVIKNIVEQIVEGCTFGKINVAKLPSFDLEYVFLRLRAMSLNNVVDARFMCQNEVDGATCNTIIHVPVSLDDIQLTVPEGHQRKFWLDENIGVSLRYPTLSDGEHLLKLDNSDTPELVPIITTLLEQVYTRDGETVIEVAEQPREDTERFVETFSLPQVEILSTFFKTMPSVSHTIHFECEKCQHQYTQKLEGLQDFFD